VTDRPAPGSPRPTIVVVGAAARDLTESDPRGWRLGGGVTYGALTTARLGLRTAALVGVDATAAEAAELDLLREAGVEVRLARLEHGPIFRNIERPEGRLQLSEGPSDPIAIDLLPDAWRRAPGWILAPVAGELPPAWASVPDEAAIVALGWQGLLRELIAGEAVRRIEPAPDAILGRADLVGLSRDDVDGELRIEALQRLIRSGGTLAVTHGDHGGLIVDGGPSTPRIRRYPAVRSTAIVDPTGAGDVFLAALTAARVEPRLVGGRIGQGYDLLLAAAAASLVLEAPGLHGVPDRATLAAKMTAVRRAAVATPAASGTATLERSG